MKKLILLPFSLLALSAFAAPQCVVDAVKANRDTFQYLNRQEIRNYVRTWCDQGRSKAEAYLGSVLNERADDAYRALDNIYKEQAVERRHQELINAIRDAGDYCSYATLPELCKVNRGM